MARLADLLRSTKNSPKKAAYCPDIGEIIKISFDPQVGREQAERRPALVLSPIAYNERARLCVLCPITSKAKGYPFEIAVLAHEKIEGVVLVDQIKSFSWEGRDAEFVCTAPDGLLTNVTSMLKALLKID